MTIHKLKRQIEILAMVEQSPSSYSVYDLCEFFDVEVATIQRDLRELRSQGFLIHSSRKKLHLLRLLKSSDYASLLSLYLPLCYEAITFPKNISLTVKKLKDRSLQTFVALAKAIEDRRELEIRYYKVFENQTVVRRIQPYQLFPTTRDWRLIARSDSIFKQFFVDNIREIEKLSTHFVRDASFDSLRFFENTWEVYRGEHPITVKLLFSKKVARLIKDRIWSENQIVEDVKGGKVLLTLQVGNLEEILGWVMGWGGDVRVVEPKTLRKCAVDRAKRILRPYKSIN